MKTIKSIFLTLTLSVLAVYAASAQTTTGTIKGLITDQNGAVIPGAKISITQPEKGRDSIYATTNSEGEFVTGNLPLGVYQLTVKVSGFNRSFSRRVELTSAQPTRSDIVFSFEPCSDEEPDFPLTKLTDTDRAAIVRELIDLLSTGWRSKANETKIILTPDNFQVDWLTETQRSRVSIMTRTSIQNLTEKTNSFLYYSITVPKQRGSCVAISIVNNLTVKGQMEDANMAGGADNYEFRKVEGKWIGLLLSSYIS